MKVNVFYKFTESSTVKKSPEDLPFDTKAELARLKIELASIQDWPERKKKMRDIARLERFDDICEQKHPEKEAISKILKGKTSENYLGSDLLTLKKRWIDIIPLVLVPEINPEIQTTKDSIKWGDIFTVNFWVNKSLNASIGAGDILPIEVSTIRINGVEWTRRDTPRPGYYAGSKYLPVFDSDKIEIVSRSPLNEEDTRLAQEASEKRWRYMRMEDTIQNDDKTMTDLPEDIELQKRIEEYKTSSERITKNFKWTIDKVKATTFRISYNDFSNLAESVGLPNDKIEIVKKIMAAIGQHESNSNYWAVGQILPSGSHKWTAAIGRYQIMPKNWVSWWSAYFWGELDTTPENQDKIAFSQMSKYYMRHLATYGNNPDAIFREIAWDWYGRWSAQIAWHPDTWWYQWSVLAIYRTLRTSENPLA